MITNVNIEKLHPHPNNPRKDLGELTELADSIRKNGILQNLTVVPWVSTITGVGADDPKVQEEMGYRVVIGHRRLAAAKLAGLEEVPCTITEMDEKTQIATMLLENIQRTDLTIYEQASGFQMMLDLGDTVTTIAEQTGFSETTVRNRVKLLELDREKFKDSQTRGATLMDYVHLSEIKDLKKRNKVLEVVGTSDFEYKMRQALNEQKEKQNRPLIKKELASFATLIKDKNTNKYDYVSRVNLCEYEPGKLIPKDAEKKKYFFTWDDERSYNIAIYKEGFREKSVRRAQEEIDREKAVHETEAMLRDITALCFETRKGFVESVTIKKSQIQDLLEFVCKAAIFRSCNYCGDNFREAFKIGTSSYIPEIQNEYFSKYDEDTLRYSLLCAWALLGDSKDTGYFQKNYGGQKMPDYKENKRLDLIYEFLKKFRYEMSEDEKMLQDGTHELFIDEGVSE